MSKRKKNIKTQKPVSSLLLGVVCFGFVTILSALQSNATFLNITSALVRFSLMFLGAYWLDQTAQAIISNFSQPENTRKKKTKPKRKHHST